MGIKRKIKVLSLALVAVAAFGAMAAGSAQGNAPRWTRNGTTIGTGVEKTFTSSSAGTVKLVSAGLGITLAGTTSGDCTATGNMVGSSAGIPGTSKSMVLQCKNIEVVGAEGTCVVHSVGAASGTIVTVNLKGTLVWLTESGDAKVGNTLVPESGVTFATLEITGALCPVSGSFSVTGTLITEIAPVTADVKSGTQTAPSTAIKTYWTNQTPTRTKDEDAGLKLGVSSSVLSGVLNMTPGGSQTFGVEPG